MREHNPMVPAHNVSVKHGDLVMESRQRVGRTSPYHSAALEANDKDLHGSLRDLNTSISRL